MTAKRKSCVVVFGAGRSGTSTTMKLLKVLGLRLSAELKSASRDNPDGHFEDVRIMDAQQALMTSIGFFPLAPRPKDWMADPAYVPTKHTLTAIVRGEVESHDSLWGFKDPRTCVLWPMWEEILGDLHIDPVIVFCTRRSSSIVSSLMKAYGLTQEMSEGVVLYRTYHALNDLGRPIYFVDYERWWSEPARQLESLAVHCGLDDPATDYDAVIRSNVRAELNREAGSELQLSKSLRELDQLFGVCQGTDYAAEHIARWCNGLANSLEDLRFVVRGVERLHLEHGARLYRAASDTPDSKMSHILRAVRRRIRG